MKNGVFATYRGKEYSAGISKNGRVILRSPNEEDMKIGFEDCRSYNKNVVCVKYVDRNDVNNIYRARTMAKYKGFDFEVVEENGDKIMIETMLGDYRNWEKLDMTQVEQLVYQKWINKEDAEIRVEKEEL